MKNIRIILQIFFFISAVIFIFLTYNAVNSLTPDISVRYLFTGILLSIIFLFISSLIFQKHQQAAAHSPGKETLKKVFKPENTTENIPEQEKKIDENRKIEIEKKSEALLKNVENAILKEEFSTKLLRNLANEFSIVQGVVFLLENKEDTFKVSSTYAIYTNEEIKSFTFGEGINGQVAKNKELLHIVNIPENYITVLSGLGHGSPNEMLIFPIVSQQEDRTIAIVEIASFIKFPDNIIDIYKNINNKLSSVVEKLK